MDDNFESFVRNAEPRLRRALVGARGAAIGREATAEALAYAWEHWNRVRSMSNPVGYLYRVGQSRTRARKVAPLQRAELSFLPEVEPALAEAMKELTDAQRAAVFLVHGCGWSHADVAEVLDIGTSTVSTHVLRGLAKLRELLEVTSNA